MDMISLTCASCGAPLEAPAEQDVVTCEYCQTQLVIRKPPAPDPKAGETAAKAPASQRAPYTEVLEAVRSGADIASSAAKVVDTVSHSLFWVKVALIVGLLIIVLGCCGIPSFVFYRVMSSSGHAPAEHVSGPSARHWTGGRTQSSVSLRPLRLDRTPRS